MGRAAAWDQEGEVQAELSGWGGLSSRPVCQGWKDPTKFEDVVV